MNRNRILCTAFENMKGATASFSDRKRLISKSGITFRIYLAKDMIQNVFVTSSSSHFCFPIFYNPIYRGLVSWKGRSTVSCSRHPADFITNMTQINSQSELISMSSLASPSYLTIRSSVYMILIWDPWIFNLYNLWQTGSSYIGLKPHQCVLHFNE